VVLHPLQFETNAMNSQTRDTLALVAIASLAILIVLYADSGLGAIFASVLAHW
jgi:hypothetical protein